MSISKGVISILTRVLQLQDEEKIHLDTSLLGALPEFDSMAVVSILTELEEAYGFFVNDDEIDAEIFETVSSLVKFVEGKV